jgi:hypothetical protein
VHVSAASEEQTADLNAAVISGSYVQKRLRPVEKNNKFVTVKPREQDGSHYS